MAVPVRRWALARAWVPVSTAAKRPPNSDANDAAATSAHGTRGRTSQGTSLLLKTLSMVGLMTAWVRQTVCRLTKGPLDFNGLAWLLSLSFSLGSPRVAIRRARRHNTPSPAAYSEPVDRGS